MKTNYVEAAEAFPLLSRPINLGNGAWLIRSIIPAGTRDGWITTNQAAQLLHVSQRTVYRWLGEFLAFRRPKEVKMEVSLSSVLALRRATDNPQFWDQPALQEPIRLAVQAAMPDAKPNQPPCMAVASSLQPGRSAKRITRKNRAVDF